MSSSVIEMAEKDQTPKLSRSLSWNTTGLSPINNTNVPPSPKSLQARKKAVQLILLFGLVSLFGDIVYEGARSVNGPYLKMLGANAVVVGFIAGFGEFIGYAVRLLSGYFADRTRGYWFFVIAGYGLLISVPLLSLAGIWQVAALFIITERLGKALRAPARDTIMSQAAKQVGTGFGFALAEVMDQIGALAGPLIIAGALALASRAGAGVKQYQVSYAIFWVPFILVMACVVFARFKVPAPETLESPDGQLMQDAPLSKVFWLYVIFTFVSTAGFVNFMLMGYHFKVRGILSDAQIPLYYAVAMAVDGAAALIIGKTYDRLKEIRRNEKAGLSALIAIPVLTAPLPFLAFSRNLSAIIVSVVVWGIIMGIHETIMRSAIADLVALRKRGTGYGIFNTAYGLAMLCGGVAMGFLYDRSIPALCAAVFVCEALAIIAFLFMQKEACAA